MGSGREKKQREGSQDSFAHISERKPVVPQETGWSHRRLVGPTGDWLAP